MLSVGVIQPNYIPWRGYFDFISRVDLFLFYDDAQYTRQDWRNRNRIRLKNGQSVWLSVPVKAGIDSLIMDVEIDHSKNWVRKHLDTIQQSYGRAPFFRHYFGRFQEILHDAPPLLVDLDILLCRQICDWLGIRTELRRTSELGCQGVKDEKLIAMMQAVGGTHYLSGPAAKAYIRPELWQQAGIALDYIDYPAYPAYPQIAEPFDPLVSVLDLLFMVGPEAPRHIWPDAGGGVP